MKLKKFARIKIGFFITPRKVPVVSRNRTNSRLLEVKNPNARLSARLRSQIKKNETGAKYGAPIIKNQTQKRHARQKAIYNSTSTCH